MSVFIDAGSVEVFVNDGWALSGLITTPTDATGLSLTDVRRQCRHLETSRPVLIISLPNLSELENM